MEDNEQVTTLRFGEWTLTIDTGADCAYLDRRFLAQQIDHTECLGGGINIDRDTRNHIVGIEILHGVTD